MFVKVYWLVKYPFSSMQPLKENRLKIIQNIISIRSHRFVFYIVKQVFIKENTAVWGDRVIS